MGAHVADLLRAIETREEDPGRRAERASSSWTSLKFQVDDSRPRTEPNHHAARARAVAENFTDDQRSFGHHPGSRSPLPALGGSYDAAANPTMKLLTRCWPGPRPTPLRRLRRARQLHRGQEPGAAGVVLGTSCGVAARSTDRPRPAREQSPRVRRTRGGRDASSLRQRSTGSSRAKIPSRPPRTPRASRTRRGKVEPVKELRAEPLGERQEEHVFVKVRPLPDGRPPCAGFLGARRAPQRTRTVSDVPLGPSVYT